MIGLQIKIGDILGFELDFKRDLVTGRVDYELYYPSGIDKIVGTAYFSMYDDFETIEERILHGELPNWTGDIEKALQLFEKENNWILRRVGNLYTFHLLSRPDMMGKDESFPSMAICDLFVKIKEEK